MADGDPENLTVSMLLSDLLDLPFVPLPAGYAMRLYQPGEGALWTDIIGSAETLIPITAETFDREFGGHLNELEDRCHFLLDPNGRAIGSATAWFSPDRKDDGVTYGLVHWVAIRPEAQGRGLCKPMLSVILDRLSRSYDCAALTTSSRRIPAIKCYLDFGFFPDLECDRAVEGWSRVRSVLKHPTLEAIPGLKA